MAHINWLLSCAWSSQRDFNSYSYHSVGRQCRQNVDRACMRVQREKPSLGQQFLCAVGLEEKQNSLLFSKEKASGILVTPQLISFPLPCRAFRTSLSSSGWTMGSWKPPDIWRMFLLWTRSKTMSRIQNRSKQKPQEKRRVRKIWWEAEENLEPHHN